MASMQATDTKKVLDGCDGDEQMTELKRLQIAHEGMRLLLNCDVKQAEELFKASRLMGPELNVGYSFVTMVRSVMTYDESLMDAAYRNLEATEKFCGTGGRKFFGGPQPSHEALTPHERLYRQAVVADCLLYESILVFLRQGITSYVKGGYILRKAWKTYEKVFAELDSVCSHPCPLTQPGVLSPADEHVGTSVYDAVQGREGGEEEEVVEGRGELVASLAAVVGGIGGLGLESRLMEMSEAEDVPRLNDGQDDSPTTNGAAPEHRSGSSSPDSNAIDHPLTAGRGGVTESGSSQKGVHSSEADVVTPKTGATKQGALNGAADGYTLPEVDSSLTSLDHKDLRLRGAVFFGYGLLNIIVSLIPPKLMKVANLFGFHGSRRVGLQALEFSSKSQDAKAPLARIALLWYHTIVRPFFALDGEQEAAGVTEAEKLLKEVEKLYPNSPLFLYFQGKIHYLRSDLENAVRVFEAACIQAKDQREVEHIALYEKGWINFLCLKYSDALPCFLRLKNETRWSASYYAYLAAVVMGVIGDAKQSRELFLETAKLVKKKNNNVEKFCYRRAQNYKTAASPLMSLETQLMAIEVIYLWRALPFCGEEVRRQLLEVLQVPLPPEAQPFHHALCAWLTGGVLNSMQRFAEAERFLVDAMRYDGQLKNDLHIFSFSLFELAMVHISRDEFARARNVLNIAKDGYSDYEFEARLNFKVHSALSSLN